VHRVREAVSVMDPETISVPAALVGRGTGRLTIGSGRLTLTVRGFLTGQDATVTHEGGVVDMITTAGFEVRPRQVPALLRRLP